MKRSMEERILELCSNTKRCEGYGEKMYYVVVLYALVVSKEVDHSDVDYNKRNSIKANFVVENTKKH